MLGPVDPVWTLTLRITALGHTDCVIHFPQHLATVSDAFCQIEASDSFDGHSEQCPHR